MNRSTSWSCETELAAERASASRARSFVVVHLKEHDLAHLTDDVALVVSELVTNALLHARTPFTVTVVCDGVLVLLTVRDGSSAAPVPRDGGDSELSGRGLSIVDALSHDWGVNHEGARSKSVWATFQTAPVA